MPAYEVADVIRLKFRMPEGDEVEPRTELVNQVSTRLLIGAAIVALLTIGLVGLVAWLMRPMGEIASLDLPADTPEPQAHPVAPTPASIEPSATTEGQPTA